MLNETKVALRGNVATEPALRVTRNGTTVCSFRVAVTSRRYSQTDNKVVDAETSWYTVTCWRGLAENVVSSLRKGQGVLVQGRLRVRDFVHDDQPRTSADVTAEVVGPDLTWGTTSFTANRRSRVEEARDDVDRTDADELAREVSLVPVDDVPAGSFVHPGTGELMDDEGAEGGSDADADSPAGADLRETSTEKAVEPAF